MSTSKNQRGVLTNYGYFRIIIGYYRRGRLEVSQQIYNLWKSEFSPFHRPKRSYKKSVPSATIDREAIEKVGEKEV